MKKLFSKAIAMTAAIIMAQSTSVGAAAETKTDTAATSVSVSESTAVNYNDNEGYTVLDKWGNAYPYSYYYYANLSRTKEKEDALDTYVYFYNLLHENRRVNKNKQIEIIVSPAILKGNYFYDPSKGFRLSEYDRTYNIGYILYIIAHECPYLYYLEEHDAKYTDIYDEKYYKNGKLMTKKVEADGASPIKLSITLTSTMTNGQIAANDKKIANLVSDFKNKLEQDGVTTSKGFYEAALNYVMDNAGLNFSKKTTNRNNLVGAFFEKNAVTGGYIDAFNLLCHSCGMPYGTSGGYAGGISAHGWNKVAIGNVWYNVDTLWGTDYSFLLDSEYRKLRGVQENEKISPKGNGEQQFPKGIPTADAKPADRSKKALSLAFQKDFLKSYDNFKVAVKFAVKKAKDYGYGYLTFNTSSTETLEKYLKQAKKDGIISYSSYKIGNDYIRIKF